MNKMTHDTTPFIRYCKTNRNLSDLTIRAYGLDLKQFIAYLDGRRPPLSTYKDVTRSILDEYVSHLSQRYKVKTIKRHMACLRSYFHYLEYTECITANPFDKFRLTIKEGYRLPVSLELQEVEKILQVAYRERDLLLHEEIHRAQQSFYYFIYTRNIALLELLFASGLRVSELCSINKEQMCRDFTTVLISGKGNKERELYVGHPQVMKALKEYAALRQGYAADVSAFFITRFGKPLTTQAVRNMVTKYTQMSGISKNVTPHAFRHSFASLLLDADVNIKYIQEFLGHSSIATTQLYLHTSATKKRTVLCTMHPRQKMNMDPDELYR